MKERVGEVDKHRSVCHEYQPAFQRDAAFCLTDKFWLRSRSLGTRSQTGFARVSSESAEVSEKLPGFSNLQPRGHSFSYALCSYPVWRLRSSSWLGGCAVGSG